MAEPVIYRQPQWAHGESHDAFMRRFNHWQSTNEYLPPTGREREEMLSYRVEIRGPDGQVVDRILAQTKEAIPEAIKRLQETYAAAEAAEALAVERGRIRQRVGAAHKLPNWDQKAMYQGLLDAGYTTTVAWIMSYAPLDITQLYNDLEAGVKTTDYRHAAEEVR